MRAGRPKKETLGDTFKDNDINYATFSIPFDSTDARTLLVDITATNARVWSNDDLLYDITIFRRINFERSDAIKTMPKISFTFL